MPFGNRKDLINLAFNKNFVLPIFLKGVPNSFFRSVDHIKMYKEKQLSDLSVTHSIFEYFITFSIAFSVLPNEIKYLWHFYSANIFLIVREL